MHCIGAPCAVGLLRRGVPGAVRGLGPPGPLGFGTVGVVWVWGRGGEPPAGGARGKAIGVRRRGARICVNIYIYI